MPDGNVLNPIEYKDFEKIDVRVGTIIDVKSFPEARHPAFQLWVDFGEKIGVKKTSAQVTKNYTSITLMGRQVAAVTNFPSKQIGKFMSEVLVLGFPDKAGEVILISVDKIVPNGGKLF
ncbi:MAG: tRNA-binding protein [Alphaproteobacteria bacterium]|nr:tRNA-binding protein [Alphaproteobacteria bacterium]|tara:strand:- start:985 stop:1341 length:357 start_codon:yes stop_codon:yes gene_type:complete